MIFAAYNGAITIEFQYKYYVKKFKFIYLWISPVKDLHSRTSKSLSDSKLNK